MNNKLLEIINIILLNKEQETLAELNSSFSLTKDLGFDSFDLAELTVRIEAEFDIDIFQDGLIFTIDEIIKKLNLNE
jgi:acyl carrier protein